MARDAAILYELAIEHDGVFTAGEARLAGVSPHSLLQAARRGNVCRLARGIYRLVNFPASEERGQLWEAVLWPSTHRAGVPKLGVLSHLTALSLNYPQLEYIPPKVSITIGLRLRVRRERPAWLDVHFGSITDSEVTYDSGGLPYTTLQRTLFDCVAAHVDHRLIERAIDASVTSETAQALDTPTISQLRAMMRVV